MNVAAQGGPHGAAAQFRAPGLSPGNSAAVPSPEGTLSPGRQVGVTRLALTACRNYTAARLALGAGPVVLTGPNGAGKTNLLEAVSFLSPGRGLRNAKLSDFDRRRDNDEIAGWAIAATVETGRGTVRIGTGRDL